MQCVIKHTQMSPLIYAIHSREQRVLCADLQLDLGCGMAELVLQGVLIVQSLIRQQNLPILVAFQLLALPQGQGRHIWHPCKQEVINILICFLGVTALLSKQSVHAEIDCVTRLKRQNARSVSILYQCKKMAMSMAWADVKHVRKSLPGLPSETIGRAAKASMAGKSLPLLLAFTKRVGMPFSGRGAPVRMKAAASSRKLWCSLPANDHLKRLMPCGLKQS